MFVLLIDNYKIGFIIKWLYAFKLRISLQKCLFYTNFKNKHLPLHVVEEREDQIKLEIKAKLQLFQQWKGYTLTNSITILLSRVLHFFISWLVMSSI